MRRSVDREASFSRPLSIKVEVDARRVRLAGRVQPLVDEVNLPEPEDDENDERKAEEVQETEIRRSCDC